MRGSSRLRGDAVDRRVVFEDPEAMQRRIREEKRALKRMLADEVTPLLRSTGWRGVWWRSLTCGI